MVISPTYSLTYLITEGKHNVLWNASQSISTAGATPPHPRACLFRRERRKSKIGGIFLIPNYVSVRAEAITKGEAKKSASHDIRLRAPAYLRDDPNATMVIFRTRDQGGNGQITSDVARSRPEEVRSALYDHIDALDREQRERNEAHKTKRGGKRLQNTFIRGVITFTPEGVANVKAADLDKAAFQTLRAICERQNVKPVYIVKHLDEKTPHYHFLTEGCDLDSGKSRSCELSRQACREMQDIAGRNFGALGFVRGQSKSLTGAEHMTVKQLHAQERDEQIAQLDTLHSCVEATKTELADLHAERDQLDREVCERNDDLRKIEDKKKAAEEEKNRIDEEIKQLQDDLRRQRLTQDQLSQLSKAAMREYKERVTKCRQALKALKASAKKMQELEQMNVAAEKKLQLTTQQLQIYGGAVAMAEELDRVKTYLEERGYIEEYENWASDYETVRRQEQEQEEDDYIGTYDYGFER